MEINIYSKNIIWNLKLKDIRVISSTERAVLSRSSLPKIKYNIIINPSLCHLLQYSVGLGTLGLYSLLLPFLSPWSL